MSWKHAKKQSNYDITIFVLLWHFLTSHGFLLILYHANVACLRSKVTIKAKKESSYIWENVLLSIKRLFLMHKMSKHAYRKWWISPFLNIILFFPFRWIKRWIIGKILFLFMQSSFWAWSSTGVSYWEWDTLFSSWGHNLIPPGICKAEIIK